MCETLPTNSKELLNINGFGKTRVAKYGDEILNVIRNYCDENDIEVANVSNVLDLETTRKKKGDTKQTSLTLFKSGKSIEKIAFERDLNVGLRHFRYIMQGI